MIRCVVLSFVLLSTFVSNASADTAPPPGHKRVNPYVRFEGIEKHADHLFYVQLQTFSGGPGPKPNRLSQVIDSAPFTFYAEDRIQTLFLLAIERKEFDKRSKDETSLEWLTDKADGVKSALINSRSTTYCVSLKDGKLTLELVKELKHTEAEDQRRTEAPPSSLLPMWAFGLVSALSLAGLGIWFVRRRRSPPKAPAISPEGQENHVA